MLVVGTATAYKLCCVYATPGGYHRGVRGEWEEGHHNATITTVFLHPLEVTLPPVT